jgi:hypothetical protein
VTASAQVNEVEGWVSELDHTVIQNTLTTYLDQVNAYVATQKAGAKVSDVLGTKIIVSARRPVLALGLPYTVVVRGNVWTQIPDTLRHKFRFHLYATALDQTLEAPVLSLMQSLPTLASKKLTLSFAPASQADADLVASYLPPPPIDGSPLDPSTLPTSLPGYLIRMTAELRVDGHIVASAGLFTMGQELVSTQGVYDPFKGWQEEENTAIAGEYHAFAIDTAGIAGSQLRTLQHRLTATKAKLDLNNLTGLTKEELLGDLLYNVVLNYMAMNDFVESFTAPLAGIVTYRQPSFGRFTLVVQPHLVFGIAQTVTFSGLEMDMDHMVSLVVSKTNNWTAQVDYVWQIGLRQSALEHLIPERLLTDLQYPGEAVSAVKALAVASREGQRLYTVTPGNMAMVLPQLTIPLDVQAEIQAAVAMGKLAIVSQRSVTVGGWTGVGYILLDPETGSGAYKISGGANGSFFLGLIGGPLVLALLAAMVGANLPLFLAVLFLLAVGIIDIEVLYGVNIDRRGSTEIDWRCFAQGIGTAFAAVSLVTAFLVASVEFGLTTITVTAGGQAGSIAGIIAGLWSVAELFSFLQEDPLDECLRP